MIHTEIMIVQCRMKGDDGDFVFYRFQDGFFYIIFASDGF